MHTCWSALRETVHIFSVAWFRDRLLFFLCNFVLFTVNQNDINSNILLSAIFSVILPLLSELRLKNRRCNIYTRARFNARSTISIWEDIKKCAHRSVSTLQTIFFLKPLCVATFFFKRWMSRYKAIQQVGVHDHIWTVLSWSAFTITSGHVYRQCFRSKHDMYTVGVHDQSTTCVRWVFTKKLDMSTGSVHDQSWACLLSWSVFTIKAGHVCRQCSRSNTCLLSWSVFTIKAGHVCRQCSRSKLGMSAVSVHDPSWTCLPSVFTIKAGHVYRQCSRSNTCLLSWSVFTIKAGHVCCPGQCSRSKLGMSAVLVSVHDQSWTCLPSVFTSAVLISVHDQSWACLLSWSVFTIKAGHVYRQCSRSKLGMSAVSVHDQSWTCLPSVFTIKAHVYGGCSRSKHDMCTVGVHDQSTTCVRWVFTIKAHVYRQCSRSKHDMCEVGVHDQSTCVPSVFTIKAHVYRQCSRSKHMCTVSDHDQSTCTVSVHDQSTCVPSVFTINAHVYRQCSRSKLDMVPAPVHEGKSTQISSYFVSNVSTTTLSVKVHYQTFLQARAVNVHSKAGHVHSLAILMVTNADDGNRNHKPSRQCWWR